MSLENTTLPAHLKAPACAEAEKLWLTHLVVSTFTADTHYFEPKEIVVYDPVRKKLHTVTAVQKKGRSSQEQKTWFVLNSVFTGALAVDMNEEADLVCGWGVTETDVPAEADAMLLRFFRGTFFPPSDLAGILERSTHNDAQDHADLAKDANEGWSAKVLGDLLRGLFTGLDSQMLNHNLV